MCSFIIPRNRCRKPRTGYSKEVLIDRSLTINRVVFNKNRALTRSRGDINRGLNLSARIKVYERVVLDLGVYQWPQGWAYECTHAEAAGSNDLNVIVMYFPPGVG